MDEITLHIAEPRAPSHTLDSDPILAVAVGSSTGGSSGPVFWGAKFWRKGA